MAKAKNLGIILRKEESGECMIEWQIGNIASILTDENFDVFQSPKFAFEGMMWEMTAHPYKPMYPEIIMLYLLNAEYRTFSVEYNFELKRCENNVHPLGNGILEGTKYYSFPLSFELSKFQPSQTMMPSLYVPSIICTLKRVYSTHQSQLRQPQHLMLIKLDTLSENFWNLFADKESCDTTLLVMDREFKVHKSILIARSPIFAAIFRHSISDNQIITLPDCDPNSFNEFLQFLYCGIIKGLSYHSALYLYEIADKYEVEELKQFCRECLIENLTAQNFCSTAIIADNYNDANLSSAVQCYFNSNQNQIFATPEWESLMRNNYRLAIRLLIETSTEEDERGKRKIEKPKEQVKQRKRKR